MDIGPPKRLKKGNKLLFIGRWTILVIHTRENNIHKHHHISEDLSKRIMHKKLTLGQDSCCTSFDSCLTSV